MFAWRFVLIALLLNFEASNGLGRLHERASCPRGWTHWYDSCYALYLNTPVNFPSALQFCERKGGRVIVPDSQAENDFIWGMVMDRIAPKTKPSKGIWIDCFFNGVKRGKRSYVCYGGTEEMVYSNWRPGNPRKNNFTHSGFWKDGRGQWANWDPNKKRYVACEVADTPRMRCLTADANGRFVSDSP